MKILIVDNYDSFVYNLYQYLGEIGTEPIVRRNDEITIEQAEKLKPERIVLSPGPGRPEKKRDFGVCLDILKELSPAIPTLGVCLGHQGIIHAFGGEIVRAKLPMHGKNSLIEHDGKGIFKGVPNPFRATRYHSLVGEKEGMPSCLMITATSVDDREIMGVQHANLPIYGLQFHPEAIMTEYGKKILLNFIGGKNGV